MGHKTLIGIHDAEVWLKEGSGEAASPQDRGRERRGLTTRDPGPWPGRILPLAASREAPLWWTLRTSTRKNRSGTRANDERICPEKETGAAERIIRMGTIVIDCPPSSGDGVAQKSRAHNMPITDTNQPSTFQERDDWMRAVLKSELPPVAVRVALVIGFHLNVKAGRCDPGIDDIIAAIGNRPGDPKKPNVPERSFIDSSRC